MYVMFAHGNFAMMFGFYIAYDRPLGISEALMSTVFAILSLLYMAAFRAFIQYVNQLNLSLKLTNSENVKLLNNMHEGLMILSKPTSQLDGKRTLLSCNRAADRVFTNLSPPEMIFE